MAIVGGNASITISPSSQVAFNYPVYTVVVAGMQGPPGGGIRTLSQIPDVDSNISPIAGAFMTGDLAGEKYILRTLTKSDLPALGPTDVGADPAGSAAAALIAAQEFSSDASNLISGILSSSLLGSNIDAVKIADGSVSNTEFQYLNGITSNIQNQFSTLATALVDGLATKASAAHNHNASDITSGTLSLSLLSGITTAQLSANAGIVSEQIASLDAAKLTGQIAASLINGGNSSQFLRGDGQFSNTLGDLYLYGEGENYSTCQSFSLSGLMLRAAPTPFDNLTAGGSIFIYPSTNTDDGNPGGVDITPALNSSGFVKIYAPNFAERFRATNSGVNLTGEVALSSAGKVVFGVAGSVTAANREMVGLVGGVQTNTPSGTTIVESVGNTAVTTVSNTGLNLAGILSLSTTSAYINLGEVAATVAGTLNYISGQSSGIHYNAKTGQTHSFKIANIAKFSVENARAFFNSIPAVFASGGTVTGANREINGTSEGVQINTPTGTAITNSVSNSAITAVSATGLAVTGTMAASGAVSGTTGTFSSNLILSATNGLILRPTNTGYNALCGGSTEAIASGSFIRCYGASDGSYPGQIWIYPNTGTGLYDGAGARQAYVYSAGVLLGGACKIIYSNAGTTIAAQNEIVGTSTGLKSNVASGLYHEFLAGGVICAQFGRGGLGVQARRFSIGGYASGGSYDGTLPGIDATITGIDINIGTAGQFRVFQGGSGGGTPIRLGYSPLDGGVSSIYAWGFGSWATAIVGGQSGIGSASGASIYYNVANSGSHKFCANGTERRSKTHVGGVIIADLGAPVDIANSTTTTLMTATNRYGILEIYTNTGERCAVHVSSTGTLTFAPSMVPTSAFEIASPPTAPPTTSTKLTLTISLGSLQIITGSSAGTTIGANFRGI